MKALPLLFLLFSAPAAAQLTVDNKGAITLSTDDSKLYAKSIIIKDGGAMTLEAKDSYVYADDIRVVEGGELIIRGFVEWDNSITLQGTTVFRIAGDPEMLQFGASEGPGTATVQGTVRTELVGGYSPAANEILVYDLLSAGTLDGPIGTEEVPDDNWKYSLDEGLLRVTYDASGLPVEWLGFSGQWLGKQVRLDWQTAVEIGSSHYDVERQAGAGNWQKIGEVAAASESVTASTYGFIDPTPGPTNPILYRLRQVDLDGTFSFSNVISLTRGDDQNEVTLFPNPAYDHVFVDGMAAGAFTITDVAGREIARGQINDSARFRIDLPAGLPMGTYVLRAEDGLVRRFTVRK